MAAPITDGVVCAAQDGEAAAFRVIYEELAPVVLGYLTAKGVADPEAVTSDVFLAALPRLHETRWSPRLVGAGPVVPA